MAAISLSRFTKRCSNLTTPRICFRREKIKNLKRIPPMMKRNGDKETKELLEEAEKLKELLNEMKRETKRLFFV